VESDDEADGVPKCCFGLYSDTTQDGVYLECELSSNAADTQLIGGANATAYYGDTYTAKYYAMAGYYKQAFLLYDGSLSESYVYRPDLKRTFTLHRNSTKVDQTGRLITSDDDTYYCTSEKWDQNTEEDVDPTRPKYPIYIS
jgi:hypothetical protein